MQIWEVASQLGAHPQAATGGFGGLVGVLCVSHCVFQRNPNPAARLLWTCKHSLPPEIYDVPPKTIPQPQENGEISPDINPVHPGALSLYSGLTNQCVSLMIKAFYQLPQLSSVNLAHNHLNEEGISLFSAFLKTNSTITNLSLAHNKLKDAGAEELAKSLEFNTSLQQLDLNTCRIADAGASMQCIGDLLPHALDMKVHCFCS